MSILHSWRVNAGAQIGPAIQVMLLVLLAVSLAAAVAARVLPPRGVNGPERIPPGRPVWTLLGVLLAAAGVYLFTISAYVAVKYPPHGSTPSPTTAAQFTPADTAFMSTVPPVIGFVALMLGGLSAGRSTPQILGLRLRGLPPGIARGLLGALIVVPALFLLSQAMEIVYRAVGYKHPTEHPLLQVMGTRPSAAVLAALIAGACVVAPLFEELLFRGYLQTLLRRLVSFMMPQNVAGGAGSPPVSPNAAQTWVAIVLTSTLFSVPHPAWSRPIIFVLSVCLGYAYERTGNLWVPIMLHATFNSVSTALFLAGSSPH